MASFLITVAVSAIAFAALAVLARAGFRNGDFSGEALTRALRKDLEQAPAEHDRIPPVMDRLCARVTQQDEVVRGQLHHQVAAGIGQFGEGLDDPPVWLASRAPGL